MRTSGRPDSRTFGTKTPLARRRRGQHGSSGRLASMLETLAEQDEDNRKQIRMDTDRRKWLDHCLECSPVLRWNSELMLPEHAGLYIGQWYGTRAVLATKPKPDVEADFLVVLAYPGVEDRKHLKQVLELSKRLGETGADGSNAALIVTYVGQKESRPKPLAARHFRTWLGELARAAPLADRRPILAVESSKYSLSSLWLPKVLPSSVATRAPDPRTSTTDQLCNWLEAARE